jgi:hypothetical protein
VAEASALLADLARINEREAWDEVRTCQEPVVFEAFLATFPDSDHADEIRIRLNRPVKDQTKARRPAQEPHATEKPFDPPVAAPNSIRVDGTPRVLPGGSDGAGADPGGAIAKHGPSASLAPWKQIGVWIVAAVPAWFALIFSSQALQNMSRDYVSSLVAENIATAALSAFLAGLTLVLLGPRAYRAPLEGDQTYRQVLFLAGGCLVILVWAFLTQITGEPRHRMFGSIDNIRRNASGIFVTGIAAVCIAAAVAYLLPRMRLVLPVVALITGGFLVADHSNFISGLSVRDYWVTAALTYFSGIALIALAVIGSVSMLLSIRHRRRTKRRAPPATSASPS